MEDTTPELTSSRVTRYTTCEALERYGSTPTLEPLPPKQTTEPQGDKDGDK